MELKVLVYQMTQITRICNFICFLLPTLSISKISWAEHLTPKKFSNLRLKHTMGKVQICLYLHLAYAALRWKDVIGVGHNELNSASQVPLSDGPVAECNPAQANR